MFHSKRGVKRNVKCKIITFLSTKTGYNSVDWKVSKRFATAKEPPLGVIREQGEWPLRPKGARSMVYKLLDCLESKSVL